MRNTKSVLFVGLLAPTISNPNKIENEFWRTFHTKAFSLSVFGECTLDKYMSNIKKSGNLMYGPSSLATHARELGMDVSYLAPEPNDDEEAFLARIMEKVPGHDVVSLSYHTPSEGIARNIAMAIKTEKPEVIIIAGGPHTAGLDKVDASTTPIDLYVQGLGHAIMPWLLEGDNLENALKITKKTKFIKRGQFDSLIDNFYEECEFPIPNVEIFNLKEFPVARVFTRIGCGRRKGCSFCNEENFHGRVVDGDLNKVFSFIDDLVEKKETKFIYVHDENFFMDSEYSLQVIEKFEKYKGGLNYCVQGNIPSIISDFENNGRSILNALEKQGMCKRVEVGAESTDSRVLKFALKGGQDFDKIKKAGRYVKKHNMLFGTYWLIGLVGENEISARKTTHDIITLMDAGIIDFAESLVAVPYPGTLLFRERDDYLGSGARVEIPVPVEFGGNVSAEEFKPERWIGESFPPIIEFDYPAGRNTIFPDGYTFTREVIYSLHLDRMEKICEAMKRSLVGNNNISSDLQADFSEIHNVFKLQYDGGMSGF